MILYDHIITGRIDFSEQSLQTMIPIYEVNTEISFLEKIISQRENGISVCFQVLSV